MKWQKLKKVFFFYHIRAQPSGIRVADPDPTTPGWWWSTATSPTRTLTVSHPSASTSCHTADREPAARELLSATRTPVRTTAAAGAALTRRACTTALPPTAFVGRSSPAIGPGRQVTSTTFTFLRREDVQQWDIIKSYFGGFIILFRFCYKLCPW
jgi:hypothetical protein